MASFRGGWRYLVERPGGNPSSLRTLLLNIITNYLEIEGWELSYGFKKQLDKSMKTNYESTTTNYKDTTSWSGIPGSQIIMIGKYSREEQWHACLVIESQNGSGWKGP